MATRSSAQTHPEQTWKSPVWVEIGIDLLKSLLVTLEKAIPHFFQYCILARGNCVKSFREHLGQLVLKDLLLWGLQVWWCWALLRRTVGIDTRTGVRRLKGYSAGRRSWRSLWWCIWDTHIWIIVMLDLCCVCRVIVCNFCFLYWLARKVIYQPHFRAVICSKLNSKGKNWSTQRVEWLL